MNSKLLLITDRAKNRRYEVLFVVIYDCDD